jgi:hypothetical protein
MDFAALVRAVVTLLFLTAALAKIPRLSGFVAALRGYHILPEGLVWPSAVATVTAETTVAVALLVGLAIPVALVVAGVLLLIFAGVVALSLARQTTTTCGCLGQILELRLGRPAVAANVTLGLAALAAAPQTVLAMPWPATGTNAPQLAVVSWMAAVLVVALYWIAMYVHSVLASLEEGLRGIE